MSMGILYCLLALLLAIIFIKLQKQKQLQSPLALPILGHLYLLKNPIHRALQTLANQYGPVLFLRLGFLPVLVVSSPSAVEQCFAQNDIIFANRPRILAAKHLGYNFTTVGFSPYGDRWRNLRRTTTIHIFSTARIQTFSTVRDEETRSLLGQLYKSSKDSTTRIVNLHSALFQLTFDVTTRMVAGTRCARAQEIFAPFMLMSICDYVPILRWIGFMGIEKKLVELHKIRDAFMQDLVDKYRLHKASFSSTNTKTDGEHRKTIIGSLLRLQEAEPQLYTDEAIKGITLVGNGVKCV